MSASIVIIKELPDTCRCGVEDCSLNRTKKFVFNSDNLYFRKTEEDAAIASIR